MTAVVIVFWVSAGLLVYAQLGYVALLAVIARLGPQSRSLGDSEELPVVSVIVPAYAEQEVIAGRVANHRSLDYPPDRLELIVVCDGSPDATARQAREAGADLVLELPRSGKVRSQDAGVGHARGELLAFSDANTTWEPDALRRLVAPFSDPRVGYVCGQVHLVDQQGDNQEGVYWRYEMALRALESRVRSVTGGNGAIYATRAESYIEFDGIMGHDLSFPFKMVKRGWRAVYAPDARASEPMVPTIEGEFARKRRMSSQAWRTMLRGGMLSPRGYDPVYAVMIASHRLLRYATPFLHLILFGASIALLGRGAVYAVALGLQVVLVLAALIAPLIPRRPFLIARYYLVTTAALGAGLWDWLRRGAPAMWEPAEGTR